MTTKSLLLTTLVVLLFGNCWLETTGHALGPMQNTKFDNVNSDNVKSHGNEKDKEQLSNALRMICEELSEKLDKDTYASMTNMASRCSEVVGDSKKSEPFPQTTKIPGSHQDKDFGDAHLSVTKMMGHQPEVHHNTERSVTKMAGHQHDDESEEDHHNPKMGGVNKMSGHGQQDEGFVDGFLNKMGAKNQGNQESEGLLEMFQKMGGMGKNKDQQKGGSGIIDSDSFMDLFQKMGGMNKNKDQDKGGSGVQDSDSFMELFQKMGGMNKNKGNHQPSDRGYQGKMGGKGGSGIQQNNDKGFEGIKNKLFGKDGGGFMDDIHDKIKNKKHGMKNFMDREDPDYYDEQPHNSEGKGKKDFLNFSGMKHTFQKMKGMLDGWKHKKHQHRPNPAIHQSQQAYPAESDIYFVRLPPVPYSYVDGLGYISRPPSFSPASLAAVPPPPPPSLPEYNYDPAPYTPEPHHEYQHSAYTPEGHFEHQVRPQYMTAFSNPQLHLQSEYSDADSGSSESFIRVPIDFVSNGKPSGVYRWPPQLQQSIPPASSSSASLPPVQPEYHHFNHNHQLDQHPHGLPNSPIIKLNRGPYMFNGKPKNVFKMKQNQRLTKAKAIKN